MTTLSAGNARPWKAIDERSIALEIVLLKHTYVLPWNQFLYADGTTDEVRIAFATHDVVVKGAGLEMLLPDLAHQRVVQLLEPTRTEQFQRTGQPLIREISVVRIDERH
jgi:hypothetical protein